MGTEMVQVQTLLIYPTKERLIPKPQCVLLELSYSHRNNKESKREILTLNPSYTLLGFGDSTCLFVCLSVCLFLKEGSHISQACLELAV